MTDEQIKKDEAAACSESADTKAADTPVTPEDEKPAVDAVSPAEKQLSDENRKLTAKVAELALSLEKSESELAETRDKYLRICAEYDNFRKRSQKERDGIFTDAYSEALKEVLPIIDNLERAARYTEPEKLTDGLSLIFKSAKDMLEKLGVEEFGETGDKFDPLLHNAVMHVDEEVELSNEIVEVFQKGYKKGDRIIRHAMVKVVN